MKRAARYPGPVSRPDDLADRDRAPGSKALAPTIRTSCTGTPAPPKSEEGLAILFQPRLAPAMGHSTDVSYAVAVDESTPTNTWITNTATLSSSFITVQRQAGTLINPVDLSTSHKTAPAQVASRESTTLYAALAEHRHTAGQQGDARRSPPPTHRLRARLAGLQQRRLQL